jgi:hypothetical protein
MLELVSYYLLNVVGIPNRTTSAATVIFENTQ